MKLAVFGATGTVGSALVGKALDAVSTTIARSDALVSTLKEIVRPPHVPVAGNTMKAKS